MKIVVASSKLWDKSLKEKLAAKLGCQVYLITEKEQLTADYLKQIGPDYVFFPHWSHILKPEIYSDFKCIMFHMTDLPFGRGGSPLQNLIVRKYKNTKISAFLCDGGLDTGPVFLKKDLSLDGTAEEIFVRASAVILEMIEEIVKNGPQAVPQKGDVTEFKRRKPEEGSIKDLTTMEDVYDYIRMLDAEGYPPAFIEFGPFKAEFNEAHLSNDKLTAKVTISLKREKQ